MWTPACQAALYTLKKILETPVLSYPCVEKDFVLDTDASIQVVGAVLSQEQSGEKMHPIAFASKALSASEKNNSTTELETLLWCGLSAMSNSTYLYMAIR